MNNFLMFDNPNEFLLHLKEKLNDFDNLPNDDAKQLIAGSISAIEQIIASQNILVTKIANTISCLNYPHETWGHMLSELYATLECGQITPEDMNKVLVEEICKGNN